MPSFISINPQENRCSDKAHWAAAIFKIMRFLKKEKKEVLKCEM